MSQLHDAHVLAWIVATCPYTTLPYRKQACYVCPALSLCMSMHG